MIWVNHNPQSTGRETQRHEGVNRERTLWRRSGSLPGKADGTMPSNPPMTGTMSRIEGDHVALLIGRGDDH